MAGDHSSPSTIASPSAPGGHELDLPELAPLVPTRELDSTARKHHLVPASYLGAWAENHLVRVTELTPPTATAPHPRRPRGNLTPTPRPPRDLAPEDIPPLILEVILGETEGHAKSFIDDLRVAELGVPIQARFDPEDVAKSALFLGMTLTRGRRFRRGHEHFVATYQRDFLDAVADGRAVFAPQQAASAIFSARMGTEIGEYFLDHAWTIIETPPLLVTCDEPVRILWGPGSPRGERGGLRIAGVGLFPLSPARLLALFRRDLVGYAMSGGTRTLTCPVVHLSFSRRAASRGRRAGP